MEQRNQLHTEDLVRFGCSSQALFPALLAQRERIPGWAVGRKGVRVGWEARVPCSYRLLALLTRFHPCFPWEERGEEGTELVPAYLVQHSPEASRKSKNSCKLLVSLQHTSLFVLVYIVSQTLLCFRITWVLVNTDCWTPAPEIPILEVWVGPEKASFHQAR